MRKLFILSTALWLVTIAPALAQAVPGGTNSQAGPINTPASPATSGRTIETNPLFSLHNMPCSVSPNATGGITTSASCGTDPLAVPTQTIPSTGQASASPPPPSEAAGSAGAGGAQTSRSAGGTGGSTTPSANTAPSTGSAGGTASGPVTLCRSTLPTSGGPSGVGSLVGGC